MRRREKGAYPCVLDVLRAFGWVAPATLGGLVDVPELHPPVKQERVVCHLVLWYLGGRKVSAVVH